MQDANALVLDAVNIDLMTMHKADNDILQQMVLDFVSAYGFLGFMTALPTTVQFVTYESVYLPKNHFIKEETLSTEDYIIYKTEIEINGDSNLYAEFTPAIEGDFDKPIIENPGTVVIDGKKYKKIAVGGTFDKFHDGHKKLLATAFELGEEVEIGVTSNAFGGLKGDIDSCEDRMRCLKEFFKDRLNYTVMVLDDAYGTTVFDDEFDAIVVSEETEPVAVEINEIRDSKGMSPLDIVVVSFVLADDGHPISSTRIRSGEINKKGNILK